MADAPSSADDIVTDGERIELRRKRALALRLVEAIGPDFVDSEQDAWKRAAETVIRHHEDGTAPEQLFRSLLRDVEGQGGVAVVAHFGGDLAVISGDGPRPVFGLDEDEEMCIQQMTRTELLARVEADVKEMSKDDLVDLVRREASREWLIRMVAALEADSE